MQNWMWRTFCRWKLRSQKQFTPEVIETFKKMSILKIQQFYICRRFRGTDRPLRTGLTDFSLFIIPKHWKIYQTATKLPNGHKIYVPNGCNLFQIAI
jgi:hypothetical protein